ncbi:hypothetical protein ACFQDN_20545 [Pseudomonas asuensis]|uniref:Uncharacterized protein n=1 Tax=Pseudomonas asuensis TaxID=1825787 RepID=A0ABQ2H3K3_9PSED|nr:hypothetical protein [Pseudomonas asuensis]GGM29132.1 hypothetical protein GCM10009425_44550 [Pseudomonas asuensis]
MALKLDGLDIQEEQIVDLIIDIANELDDSSPEPYLHHALIEPTEPMEPICWVTLYMSLLPAVGRTLGLLITDSADPRAWVKEDMKHTQNLVSKWSRNAERVMADVNNAMRDQVGFDADELTKHMQRTGESMDQAEARLYSQRSSLKTAH